MERTGSRAIPSLACLAMTLALSMPSAAEETSHREWTQQMCEETATSMSNPWGNHSQLGCYGLVAKRMDIFDACYANPTIDFSKSCTHQGTPPLVLAVRNLDVATVDRLILRGADAKATFATAWGPGSIMIYAAAACRDHETMPVGCAAMLRRLIELGVDLNGVPGMNAPLIVAAANGRNVELVKVLLDAGAQINHKGQYGHTAWDHARTPGGSRKVADYLQSRGATGDPLLQIKQKLFEATWPAGQH